MTSNARRLCAAAALVVAGAGASACSVSPHTEESNGASTSPASAPPSPSRDPLTARARTPAPPYVRRVRWVWRAGVRSLAVEPTAAGRAGAEPARVREEVAAVAPEVRSRSLSDQLTCHVIFAPDKQAWYLEPERPAVGLAETIWARCNPGNQADPDLR